ncbi:high mobility group nucleosome-binding domain-containing protein 3 isoform X5 [Salmo salar]|uniref:High mobility group nucleosome-binding domain-containing protein 3 isoform X5 n=1 Tax=Salmo salar TaxID=8030 RepID=A0ABM3F1I8_SALSA|nr:high mobility group nucleosome-binding domain-containing protein 3-like isoform X5 [Salmo salar]
MPKRKSAEGAGTKDASKVTKQEVAKQEVAKQEVAKQEVAKQEKPAPPKPVEVKPKKAIAKKPVDKDVKGKKGGAKVKREDGPSHNRQTMTEICVSRSSVSVTYYRSLAPYSMSVRGQSETVRVNGD